jgi:hypothetical protein
VSVGAGGCVGSVVAVGAAPGLAQAARTRTNNINIENSFVRNIFILLKGYGSTPLRLTGAPLYTAGDAVAIPKEKVFQRTLGRTDTPILLAPLRRRGETRGRLLGFSYHHDMEYNALFK